MSAIQQRVRHPARGLEAFLSYVALPVLLLSGGLAVGIALFLTARPLATRRLADARTAGLVVILCGVAWLSLWVTTVAT